MDHPAAHSCTDLSVYCYLLNSLLIATLLPLPSYKPALLFSLFFPLLASLLILVSLLSLPTPAVFVLPGFIQIMLSGFTSLFWFDLGYSAESCKQNG